jgi:MFS family permease
MTGRRDDGVSRADGLLRSRNFQLLVSCDVISMAGNALAVVALPFAVLAIGGSAADIGYVATAGLLPMIVFLLLGGVIADRLPRHQVMVAADLLQGAAQAASAVLVLTGSAHVWELLVCAALRGTGLGFFFPASTGLLPTIVPAEARARAVAINRIGINAANIGGTAFGGVLVALAGPGWGLAADAASFAIAAALRIGMRMPARDPAAAAATPGIFRELREGWREFSSRMWLWTIVAQFAGVAAVGSATISVLGPVVAQHDLGGARSWGFILAAYGAGSVAGGVVMIWYRPRRMLLAASIGMLIWPVMQFALAVPLAVPLIVAAALVAGGAGELFSVNWVTTMQQEIPPAALSRVSSYDALGSFALTPVGTAVAGPLLLAFGAPAVLAGAGLTTVGLTLLVLAVPDVRNLRRVTAPAASAGPPDAGPDGIAAGPEAPIGRL